MHYVDKLSRNVNVYDKCPEALKKEVLRHITWARDLIKRLNQLDYHEREQAIDNIHRILDEDYEKMGFSLESKNR